MTNTEAQSRDLYGHFTKLKSVFKKGCFFYLYSIIGGNLFVLCAFKQSIIMIKVGYEKGRPYPPVTHPLLPLQLNLTPTALLFFSLSQQSTHHLQHRQHCHQCHHYLHHHQVQLNPDHLCHLAEQAYRR